MVYKFTFIPIYLSIFIGSSAYAQNVMENSRNEVLRNHTQYIDASQDVNAYGHVMRKLCLSVILGNQIGLPESDVEIIKLEENNTQSGRFAKARVAMRPYIDQMADAIQLQQDAIYLATLWELATDAERKSYNEYYRDMVGQLSQEGQRILNEQHNQEMAEVKISRTNFVDIAVEDPELVITLLKSAVREFKKTPIGSDTSNGFKLADENQIRKENLNEK